MSPQMIDRQNQASWKIGCTTKGTGGYQHKNAEKPRPMEPVRINLPLQTSADILFQLSDVFR